MTTKEVQDALQKLGWPIKVDGAFGPQTFRAVKDFQRGFALSNLVPDGHAGQKVYDALQQALDHGGGCSLHFTFKEWKSKGDGWIKVSRDLVLGLEDYRALLGQPVVIASGYRDPAHNAAVGGKPSSQHLYGNAADIPAIESAEKVKALGRFSGIGIQRANGLVRHVDVRHVGPNTTGGTPRDPTIWFYD
jgi:zinc D-Ala-D-Ala carboxypeptidase